MKRQSQKISVHPRTLVGPCCCCCCSSSSSPSQHDILTQGTRKIYIGIYKTRLKNNIKRKHTRGEKNLQVGIFWSSNKKKKQLGDYDRSVENKKIIINVLDCRRRLRWVQGRGRESSRRASFILSLFLSLSLASIFLNQMIWGNKFALSLYLSFIILGRKKTHTLSLCIFLFLSSALFLNWSQWKFVNSVQLLAGWSSFQFADCQSSNF